MRFCSGAVCRPPGDGIRAASGNWYVGLRRCHDAFGNIFNNQFSPEPHDVGVRFYLTATGAASQAQTTFTDAINIKTFDAPCTTATTAFSYGQTVCAHATGLGTTVVQIQWFNPSSVLKRTSGNSSSGSFQDTFIPDSTGTWTVKAVKVSDGSVQKTTTFTVSKAHLTVTADPQSRFYGDANAALTATLSGFKNGETLATSGVTGSASCTTPATPTSPVGSYTITCTIGTLAAGNYDFTPFVSGTLTINRAHLTVKADDKSKTYDGAVFSPFTATLSGFVNSETDAGLRGSGALSGSAGFTGAATSAVNAGSYTITPTAGSLAATNYDFTTFNDGTLTINKAHLTVTADNQSRVYGAPNPTFTATLSGFKNGETLFTSGVTGSASCTTPATPTSPVSGSPYTITCTQGTLAAGNYDFTPFVTGTLTVSKANTTTTVSDASATFGDANVTLMASVTANSPSTAMVNEGTVTFTVKNSSTIGTVISGTVSGGTATASFPLSSPTVVYAGSYSIQATYNPATTNPNFNGSSAATAGTLTVKPAPTVSSVTVTPNSQQYSDLVSFTATLSPASVNGLAPATGVTFYVGTQGLSGAQNMGSCNLGLLSGVLTCTVANVPLLEPTFPPPSPGNMAPGSHTVYAIFGGVDSNNFIVANPTAALTITNEDAAALYTGALFASTSSSTSLNATVTLSATIQDATAITPQTDPRYDPNPGDIRNATVTFINRDNKTPIATVPVGLVSLGDTTTGTATYNWSVTIPNCSTPPCSQTYTIGIIVNNYYTRNSSLDNTVVNIAQPGNNFITGGGYLVMTSSAGQAAGAAGTKNNFGFNIKYNKQGTNLQGNINTIVRSAVCVPGLNCLSSTPLGGYVYQVKGNSMTSLSEMVWAGGTWPAGSWQAGTCPTATATTPCGAVFNGKASIQDITNPLLPISIDGNATLQVNMTDFSVPASDMIGITVWNKARGLWFSSNWQGSSPPPDGAASNGLGRKRKPYGALIPAGVRRRAFAPLPAQRRVCACVCLQ